MKTILQPPDAAPSPGQISRPVGEVFAAGRYRADLTAGSLKVFADLAQPAQHNLVLVSGVGSVWPLLRSHALLNNLHPVMADTPLVMFSPHKYDQSTLQLVGILASKNYYRAFKLVP